MSDNFAVVVDKVTKRYRVYDPKWLYVLELIAPRALSGWLKRHSREVVALENVTLFIGQGERVGIIGRNGAGKTTLLRLIIGTIAPTEGSIKVEGRVGALMQTGIGFHPEFTGRENVQVALRNNSWSRRRLQRAFEDIIEFVELDEFLDQPVGTYSSGMRARLMFAVATAVEPEVLIIDEVLGAGDAYFAGKCAERMKCLTGKGRTLLLVSHSTQQVLQFCERAVWLENGRVVMDGDTLEVVKAYEEFIYKLRRESTGGTIAVAGKQGQWIRERALRAVLGERAQAASDDEGQAKKDKVSRWIKTGALEISQVRTLDAEGKERYVFDPDEPFTIRITVHAHQQGDYPCRAAVFIFAEDGTPVVRHRSERLTMSFVENSDYELDLCYDHLLLGSGSYLFSVGIFERLEDGNETEAAPYEIHSRSYKFRVTDTVVADPSRFRHPARWKVRAVASKPTDVACGA